MIEGKRDREVFCKVKDFEQDRVQYRNNVSPLKAEGFSVGNYSLLRIEYFRGDVILAGNMKLPEIV